MSDTILNGLNVLGVPVQQNEFDGSKGNSPKPPYIAYYHVSDVATPDGCDAAGVGNTTITIELYTAMDDTDVTLETSIKKLLAGYDVDFRTYKNTIKNDYVIQTVFEANFTEKVIF
jgi:hypothetical protein